MRDLAIGERIDLPAGPLELGIEAARPELLATAIGLVVVPVDGGGRAPEDFGPVNSKTRELRPGLAFGSESLKFDLGATPERVHRLIVVLYTTAGAGGGVSFKDLGELTATLGGNRLKLDLRDRGDSALVLMEIYRRGAGWRLMANGQGYSGGLPAVSAALGVPVNAPMAAPPPGSSDYGGGRSRPPRGSSASGSGFAVGKRLLLTNHHVVEDAESIEIAGERMTCKAEPVLLDPRNDIALLQIDRDVEGLASFRDDLDIHLGEDVVVLGFPLQGLLGSGPQVSAGNVSGLCGIANDSSLMQFTAPIASGNSGGPILDAAGLVIGLVCSSLNVDRVRQGGGSAENINFGVKAALIRSFLSTAGVPANLCKPSPPKPRAEIARAGRDFIYRIRCQY
jgi:S1-C subfamily serine protease